MDVSTFYALFSATCFTLVGLWWTVVERNRPWLRDPATRRRVGAIYLSFLLPALMGLFAQVGGTEVPLFWRASFVVIAAVGALGTVRLLRAGRNDPDAGIFARLWWASAVLYAVIAVVGVAPELAGTVGLTPLQAEATMLILLVAIAHAVAWEFMTRHVTDDPAGTT
ncbi:MAG TPA: hypothetical protein PLI84_03915 [Ornithinibacter sp.]|nr:hypothetical protein [Ornithinibacter sp.]HPV89462.1 hypothetical protein [Ornithinibacter sp.]